MLAQGAYKISHRDLHDPLDTGYPEDFKTESRITIEEVVEDTPLTRFMSYLGLPVQISTGFTTTDKCVTSAMEFGSMPDEDDQAKLRRDFNLDRRWKLQPDMTATVAIKRASALMKAMELKFEKTRQRGDGGVRQHGYTVVCM